MRPPLLPKCARKFLTESRLLPGFPLFAGQMYTKLGTVGATALLAGLTTLMIPLP